MSGRQFSFIKPKIKVGSLAERRKDFEKLVKGADSSIATNTKGVVLSPEAKAEIKKGISTTLKKTSKLRDDIDKIKGTEKEYKAKGGRVGKRQGGGLGAQSVKYGLDNNYAITAADPKAKFIAKNKKN